jgi:hypothetical protein
MLVVAPALAYDAVQDAVAVHVSAAGFERLGAALARAMPVDFPVGAITGELVCDEADPEAMLTVAIDAFDIGIHVDTIDIIPSTGRLDLALNGTIDSSVADVATTGSCPPVEELDETCTFELPAVAVSAQVGMTMVLVNGALEVTVDEVSLELPPITNPLDACTLASAVGTMLGQDPYAITDLMQEQLDASLADLAPTIESSIEEGFASLNVSTEAAFGEGGATLALTPNRFDLGDEGLLLTLQATVAPLAASSCVTAGSPPSGDASFPTLDGVAPDGALEYDVAVLVNGQFVDQLLYAMYESGALCLDAGALSGLALDTSLFGAVFGDEWDALFPVSRPMDLFVTPVVAPTVRFEDDGAPIRLDLNGLALRAFTELDARQAKAFGIRMEGEIGLDLPWSDGVIAPSLDLDADGLGLAEEDTELLSAGYADAFASLLPTILGAALPADLLGGIALPSWQGIGLGAVWWMPSDPYLGAWLVLDTENPEPVVLEGCSGGTIGCDGLSGEAFDPAAQLGCDESGGCSGCSGEGCSSDGCGGCVSAPLRPVFFGMALALAVWRRRR